MDKLDLALRLFFLIVGIYSLALAIAWPRFQLHSEPLPRLWFVVLTVFLLARPIFDFVGISSSWSDALMAACACYFLFFVSRRDLSGPAA